MLERPRRDPSQKPEARNPRTPLQLGRFAWGEHLYAIIPIANQGIAADADECCRFDIGEATFGVFEMKGKCSVAGGDAADDILRRLSGRELQIAMLVAQGYATKNIAYRLQISEWTVATYLRRVYAKLDVDNRAAMVYRCAPLICATALTFS
jgi:DNA-binding CsgD family transcriptional regulator